jgi:hypothetical protein
LFGSEIPCFSWREEPALRVVEKERRSVQENVHNQKENSSPRVWDKIALLYGQTLNDLHIVVKVTWHC